MEESISNFCRSLASFSNHLNSSCEALTQSVGRRALPLGNQAENRTPNNFILTPSLPFGNLLIFSATNSASSAFIQSLNRSVSSASSELNLLESMSLGTVSLEELLGHFNEVYQNNQNHILDLEDRLTPLGYVREVEIDDDDKLLNDDPIPLNLDSKIATSNRSQLSLDDDDLIDDSLSLKNMGPSNVCLECLASGADNKIDDPDVYSHKPVKDRPDELGQIDYPTLEVTKERMHLDFGEVVDDSKPALALPTTMKLSKDEFKSFPSFMKGLASWEDLLAAVDKINSNLRQRTSRTNFFHQDEISSLDLGPKERSYVLLLACMNRLKVDTIDVLISYRVL